MTLLAKLIRKGSEMTEPRKGGFIAKRGAVIECCALGAAAYACKKKLFFDNWNAFEEIMHEQGIESRWLQQRVRSPIDGKIAPMVNLIVSLNDGAGWTREAIADWVDKVAVE